MHFNIEIGRFAFLRPPLGDLGATYDDCLRLIGKRVVDFLLALIELFRYELRLRSYERLLVENRRFRSNGGRLTHNFRYQPFFFSKTRLNALSYGIKIWTDLSTVLSQYTRVTDRQTDRQTDRRTDGQTDRILITIPRLHYMQRVKK